MQGYRAILQGKCPRCRRGDMFPYSTYNISRFYKMHSECKCCGATFRVEPGFYFGALYVSYAFVVGIVLGESLLLYYLLKDPDLWVYFVATLGSVILLIPPIFRFSRILFLHLFGGISYDPSRDLKNC